MNEEKIQIFLRKLLTALHGMGMNTSKISDLMFLLDDSFEKISSNKAHVNLLTGFLFSLYESGSSTQQIKKSCDDAFIEFYKRVSK